MAVSRKFTLCSMCGLSQPTPLPDPADSLYKCARCNSTQITYLDDEWYAKNVGAVTTPTPKKTTGCTKCGMPSGHLSTCGLWSPYSVKA